MPYYAANEWFVAAKYNALKDEMIQHITIDEWNEMDRIATIEMKENGFIQSFVASSDKCDKYNITLNSKITKDHIIAVLLYSDIEVVRNGFNATFKRKNKNEPNSHIKRRHANYAIFDKLLRECAEIYGTTFYPITKTKQKLLVNGYIRNHIANIHPTILILCTAYCVNEDYSAFYGGFKQSFFRGTIDFRHFAPTFATDNANDALNHNDSQGLLLQFNGVHMNYFDRNVFLHQNPNSMRYVFVGSIELSYIQDIINLTNKTNHSLYIDAIKFMFHAISNVPYSFHQQINNSPSNNSTQHCHPRNDRFYATEHSSLKATEPDIIAIKSAILAPLQNDQFQNDTSANGQKCIAKQNHGNVSNSKSAEQIKNEILKPLQNIGSDENIADIMDTINPPPAYYSVIANSANDQTIAAPGSPLQCMSYCVSCFVDPSMSEIKLFAKCFCYTDFCASCAEVASTKN